jgi:dihydrofolate synthase/folylpolyglutamate synthase
MRKPPNLPDSQVVEGLLAWLDARQDYERTPPRSSRAAFGLGRMRQLLKLLGNPQQAIPVAHVAGTKGKGSSVAMLAGILEAAGHRTGRYMSPHIHRVEERIAVNGMPITTVDLATACGVVQPAVERLDRLADRRGVRRVTWFEVMTAVAFVHFARSNVDIAVLETGLGGRLDATNVCRPVVTVITSISLDHMKLLGRTVGRITAEKAGIIKRGCPVISGAVQPSARRVIAATAHRRRARLFQLGRDFQGALLPVVGGAAGRSTVLVTPPATLPGPESVRAELRMPGRHQADNAALAVVAALVLDTKGFSIPAAALSRGLAATMLPARIETIGQAPLVIVDAAHNEASMQSLIETLAGPLGHHRPRVLLFAASRDKQLGEMLATARGWFDHVILTRYRINPRAAEIEPLAMACRSAGLPTPEVAESAATAFRRAERLAGRRGIVVAAGSFFLAAEIRAAAGLTATES